jgi:hypothetical protein
MDPKLKEKGTNAERIKTIYSGGGDESFWYPRFGHGPKKERGEYLKNKS